MHVVHLVVAQEPVTYLCSLTGQIRLTEGGGKVTTQQYAVGIL